MSLLAPLYIAGALAVALPIIFHLIRRTPQKRQEFSSLMFLSPSPPRLTRRSRLSNIFLLILRATALALLALAFARPFFYRQEDLTVDQAQGRRVALLVDTSASMKRGDLWQQAKAQVERALDDLAPTDQVALFLFDRTVTGAFTFDQWNQLDLASRANMLKARLDEASPTFAATHLGEALATVAALLAESSGPDKADETTRRQIILISDLQQGSHIETLQGHEWPEHVLLDVKPVTLKLSSDASVQVVQDDPSSAEAADGKLRVRVTNQPGSTRDQFALTWANTRGPIPQIEPHRVYVPPGRSQMTCLGWPAPEYQADRIVLSGDDVELDNTVYVVTPTPDVVRIVYLGDDAPDDTKGLLYYLRSALGNTARRKIDWVQRRTDKAIAESELVGARLVVVAAGINTEQAGLLRRFIETGGDVLWVVKDVSAASGLAEMLQTNGLTVNEAPPRDFALIGQVDFEHPLFALLADSRFADFSKIHFWKHRVLSYPQSDPADGRFHTLAAFDNGDPLLVEHLIGRGRLWIMTAGWHPADGQLALSTKFVPLTSAWVQKREPGLSGATLIAAEPISLPVGASPRRIRTPHGQEISLPADVKSFDGADEPGVYHLSIDDETFRLAVNLSPDESRTAPLAVSDLEQWGAKLSGSAPPEVLVARQRELKLFELENRQKVWRWLIVIVLGLTFAETALAGRLSRRPTEVTT